MKSSTSVTSLGGRSQAEAIPNLTPRSEKACLLAGVEPRELVPLAAEAFAEPGQPAALQHLKWQKYEDTRQEAFRIVQMERERLIAQEQHSTAGDAANRSGLDMSASSMLHEQRMVEKIRRRQQAEIEGMFMQEIKTMKVMEEKQDRIKVATVLEERKLRDREAKLRQAAEERRVYDLERAKEEEERERAVRRKQMEEMEKEAKLREDADQAARKRQHELVKREEDRQRRLAEKKERQQEQLEVKQREARRKAEEDSEREYQRLQRIEEKREQQLITQSRTRSRIAQRVAGTLRAHAERVEEQRRAFLDKQDVEEQRRVQFSEQRDQEIFVRRRRGEMRQREVQAKLTKVERRSEERKHTILEKERQHEEMMAKLEETRQRKAMVERTEKDMHFYSRQMKLARNLRREEYKREMTAEKIQKENERAEELAAQRRELLKQRRHMRSESSLSRERVASRIDQMRSSASFDVDETVRTYIHNPELNELIERCIEIKPQPGPNGSRVSLDTMRTVLAQMQAEGKLAALTEARKGKTESGSFVSSSRSAPDLMRPRPGTAQ